VIVTLGGTVLETDREENRRLYLGWETVTDSCSCDGCRNFLLALPALPGPVRDFFASLGVDLRKAAEVIPWNGEDGGKRMHYGGFYHLGGLLLEGGLEKAGFFPLAEGFCVAFTEEISLPEADCPSPALQLEIDFSGVPWLLETRNPY